MMLNAKGTQRAQNNDGARVVRPMKRPLKLAIAVALVVPISCSGSSDKNHASAMKSSASVPGSVLFIPASAHVTGALGTNWRTDLELYNPGQAQATVTVSLLRANQSNSNPSQQTYNLDPGESMRHEDVLTSVFGFEGAAALRVTNDSGMVAVTSRTYNLTDNGTYGQFVGGVISHTAIQAGQEGRIIQLTHNNSSTSGFRTNIGFVNTTDSQITVQVALYRADGSYLGTKAYTLAPYEFRQINRIFQKVTSTDVNDGYAVLSTSTAGGAFFAYATVIDNRTSDPVYITSSNRGTSSPPPPTTPTPTPSTTGTATPTPTPTPTATPTSSLNLAPYQPDGWGGPLVVAGSTGTRTSGGLSASGPSYFSGAVANYGPDNAVFAADSTVMRVDLDGSSLIFITGPSGQPFTLEAGTYAYFEDLEVSNISAGSHTSTLIADPDGLVAEDLEGDNSWDYVGSWSAKASTSTTPVKVPEARIHVAPIPGWEGGRTFSKQGPLSFIWTGSAPLTPGPFQAENSKATTVDDAIYIPAAAHVSGALGTNWRTDVQLHNPGVTQARVEVAMLVRNRANATPETRTFIVAAGTSVRLEDILYSSFTFDGAAALRMTILDGDIIATSRTYNLTDTGTYGQFAGTVRGQQAFVTGERAVLMQLTHNTSNTTGFRTNVGMVNCSGNTTVLDLDFRSSDGSSYGTVSYTLRPYEFIQKDKIFKEVTSSSVSDGYIVFTSSSAGARFLAYATVIDNQTADSIFIPATSVLGAEPVAAAFIPAAEAAFAAMGLIGQGDLPSIETMVGGIQLLGMDGFIARAAALLPPGVLTPLANGWRADVGPHFVAQTGDIVAGSITSTYSNLVNESGQLSYDYEMTGENLLWNGQYAEIGGATGIVDLHRHRLARQRRCDDE